MKKVVLVVVLLFVCIVSFAQQQPELKLNAENNLIEATYYHDNGEISQKGTFNMNKQLHGDWVSFNEEGEKISIGSYSNGVKTGKWAFWSDGDMKEVVYSNNAIASVDGIKREAPVVKN